MSKTIATIGLAAVAVAVNVIPIAGQLVSAAITAAALTGISLLNAPRAPRPEQAEAAVKPPRLGDAGDNLIACGLTSRRAGSDDLFEPETGGRAFS